MKITKKAMAGSVESGDILVTLEPSTTDKLDIVLTSTFDKQYHKNILDVAEQQLAALNITSGKVILNDQGALPGAIRARIITAVDRMGDAQ
ncbi:citrate lyase acyl carrier protein [Mesoplasma lactucae]|uniref:Citrate lyase acyl carrier protein n=1 Tax=Mesoplasma lactucae ATCC 49193 TaxID=81460 RepID=A0A291IS33_9MOLU|nr:citrate lyase acyl carrier protein [Mesoplasma lactucae]ATG97745.1 citrate lyase acyl carrier protein [Mesoplasma lactucae ATCC 49193]ATZ20478.1 citrate lyase subunit gamma (acyl carrier protein) [Mesoplasma lactucae ATCC 49193]MCL8216650.1 Citrate lyase acyl carrier protein [Mesoplasma lactucae ATCC 49193]